MKIIRRDKGEPVVEVRTSLHPLDKVRALLAGRQLAQLLSDPHVTMGLQTLVLLVLAVVLLVLSFAAGLVR